MNECSVYDKYKVNAITSSFVVICVRMLLQTKYHLAHQPMFVKFGQHTKPSLPELLDSFLFAPLIHT